MSRLFAIISFGVKYLVKKFSKDASGPKTAKKIFIPTSYRYLFGHLRKHVISTCVKLATMQYSNRIVFFGIFLSSCASQTSTTLSSLEPNHPNFNQANCVELRRQSWVQQDLKNVSTVAVPALVFALGPLAVVPVLVGSVGVISVDHSNAAKISEACANVSKSTSEVVGGVVKDSSIGILTKGLIPVPTR